MILDLNTLGFKEMELEEGQLPDGALMIVRSHMDGGKTRYSAMVTDGLDYAVALGMVQILAANVDTDELFLSADDEEEDDDEGP